MKKILLVEDDLTTQKIVHYAIPSGMELIIAVSIAEALQILAEKDDISLLLVDRSLPDGDGIQICSQVRGNDRQSDLPIIFLSGRATETDKVTGLFAGGDDYVTKPFSVLELKARITSRLRTSSKKLFGGLIEVDLEKHRAYTKTSKGSVEIDLTRIEFKMLVLLMQTLDRLHSRDSILQKIWGDDLNVSDRVVDTHLSHLRKKLVNTGLVLEAVRGEGYRLRPLPTVTSKAS